MELNTTAYAEYSPVYLSACLNVTYTIAYALTTAVVVHALLWHGPRLWHGIRNVKTEVPDIHLKLIRQYPEVPDWWYGVVFVVLFALAVVCIEVFETNLPVWGLVVALLLALVYFLPTAIIYATTVQLMTINLIAELIPGYMLPGKPIAVMVSPVLDVLMDYANTQSDVQGLFDPGPHSRRYLYSGPKTRSLHEDPTQVDLLRSVCSCIRRIARHGRNQDNFIRDCRWYLR